MSRQPCRGHLLVASLMLLMHIGLAGWQCAKNSPTVDEYSHLVGGLSIWTYERFELYRVNPPLVKALAALPAAWGGAQTDWRSFRLSTFDRPAYTVGSDFVAVNPDHWFVWLMLARWILLPLSVVGGIVCFCWGRELYGARSGLIALALWCFSPNTLAWSTAITADIGATSLGALAAWRFWRWLKQPSWSQVSYAGLALGLAELAKMTWVILFGLWPVLWLFWKVTESRAFCGGDSEPRQAEDAATAGVRQSVRRAHGEANWRKELVQLAGIIVLGLYFLNLGYLFEGSFQRLGTYVFGSRVLAGDASIADSNSFVGGNRFAGTWLGTISVPLPKDYVTGMDLQRIDFERKLLSYFNGAWKKGGWWYYYLEALLIKVPLGTWLVAFVALYLSFSMRTHRTTWRDEFVLLAPAIVVLVLVSSQTGFSRYPRYLLPAFPFAFIWCAKVGRTVEPRRLVVSSVAKLGLAWSIASSLWICPHSMSYFNELTGGPNGGSHYLLDSNIDWGQDVFYLKQWCDAHPEAQPMNMSVAFSPVPVEYFGLKNTRLVTARRNAKRQSTGWYAVSVHALFAPESRYKALREDFMPVAKAGYSIWIYHVEYGTRRDAADVRMGGSSAIASKVPTKRESGEYQATTAPSPKGSSGPGGSAGRSFGERLEELVGRVLRPQKRGRKPRFAK